MKTRFAALLWDRVLLLDTVRPGAGPHVLPAVRRHDRARAAGPVLPGVAVAVGRTVRQSVGQLGVARPAGRPLPSGSANPSGSATPSSGPSRARRRASRAARASVPAQLTRSRRCACSSHRDPATGKRSFGVVAIDLVITARRARERRRPRRDGRPARHVLAAGVGRLGGAGQGRLRDVRQGRPPRASRRRVHAGRRDPDAREDRSASASTTAITSRRAADTARSGPCSSPSSPTPSWPTASRSSIRPAATPSTSRPSSASSSASGRAAWRPPMPSTTSPATSSPTTSRPATGRASSPRSTTARWVTDSGSGRRGRIPSCR